MKDVIVHDYRAEQLVDGEWVEIPMDDLTLIMSVRDAPRLMRGPLEVGGEWRLFIDDELVCCWNPVLWYK